MSFYFNWQLALVLLAGYPLLIFAAYLQTQLQTSGFQKDAMLMEDCGRVSIFIRFMCLQIHLCT